MRGTTMMYQSYKLLKIMVALTFLLEGWAPAKPSNRKIPDSEAKPQERPDDPKDSETDGKTHEYHCTHDTKPVAPPQTEWDVEGKSKKEAYEKTGHKCIYGLKVQNCPYFHCSTKEAKPTPTPPPPRELSNQNYGFGNLRSESPGRR
jgi:hypothetical protein